ncbi:MAG: hypothetical protein GY705_25505, partial [Bacteroidetes bacterium]|nr:hypothetical protein [Bacteroidota bacterium]
MFFGSPNSDHCRVSLQEFLMLADSIGLPIKHEKTVFPTTVAELHGLQFDSNTMILSVPMDKVQKAVSKITEILGMDKVSLLDLQSVAGLLGFCSKAIPAGRTFLRRIFDLTKGLKFQKQRTILNEEARKDLITWWKFLIQFNGCNIINHIDWSHDFDWRFFSDASGRGYAAVFGNRWIQGAFPEIWLDVSTAAKELAPIFMAFQLWVS